MGVRATPMTDIEQLKRDHDGLYWKVIHLERKVNSLESEVRRLRK